MNESSIGMQEMSPLIISRKNDEPERGIVAAMSRTEVNIHRSTRIVSILHCLFSISNVHFFSMKLKQIRGQLRPVRVIHLHEAIDSVTMTPITILEIRIWERDHGRPVQMHTICDGIRVWIPFNGNLFFKKSTPIDANYEYSIRLSKSLQI